MILSPTQKSKLEILFPDEIPEIVKEHIMFFEELDNEYKLYANNNRNNDRIMFSLNHIKNKNWRGLWLHATGADKNIYINWLYSGYKYEDYREKSLLQVYKESYPNEKYIPYSIITADNDLKIYFKM